jgi:hypothetical protein
MGATLQLRRRADGRDVPRREVAPVRDDGRQRGSHFRRAEVEQPMAGAGFEPLHEPVSECTLDCRRVVGLDGQEAPLRRELQRHRDAFGHFVQLLPITTRD